MTDFTRLDDEDPMPERHVQTVYRVEFHEGDRWIPSVREDLYDGDNPLVLQEPAEFLTREAAEVHIETIRGLMHMGGDDTVFRIVTVRRAS